MKAASHASTYFGAAACARENQPSDPRGRSLRSLRCDPRRARENLAQFRRPRRGEGARGIDPFDGVDLVAQARFASRPARNERGDDEMRSYSCPFGKNRLHMAVKSDDFGFDSDLFHEFPGERGGERLSHFDPAAWQTEMAQQRRPRAADDERPAVSKHRRRDRKDWARGKQPIIHGLYSSRMVESRSLGRGSAIGGAGKKPPAQSRSPYKCRRSVRLASPSSRWAHHAIHVLSTLVRRRKGLFARKKPSG